MKLQKSLPQNAAFFERYADLIHTLTKAATIAQLFTGLCEIGILTALSTKILSDLLPPQYVGMSAFGCGVLFAALLQMALRQVVPKAVQAQLYRRYKGLDLPISIGIYLLTIVLLSFSVWLSWEGSKDIADVAIKPPTEKTTDKQDSDQAAAMATAQRLFTSDSATIETKYKGKNEAIESEYTNRINSIERGGKHATTLRAELKTKLARLEADKATEIETKATDRKAAMDEAKTRHRSETATISTDNQDAKTKANEKRNRYGGYIGYFTAFCYLFFLVVFALNEIYNKGANIETKPIPSQRHFNPSVLAEFAETVKEKIDVFFRTKIQAWADRTPAQPLPITASVLYDHTTDILTDTLKIETTAKQMKAVKLPLKLPGIAAQKTNDLTDDSTPKTTTNPPRQIGFRKETADDANDTEGGKNEAVTKIVGGINIVGSCPNCLYTFTKNHRKQVYCSDPCRREFWEKKTGKKIHNNRTGKG